MVTHHRRRFPQSVHYAVFLRKQKRTKTNMETKRDKIVKRSSTAGVSEEKAPNGNKRTKLIDPEKRVENDGETDVPPRVLCTMKLTPKMDSPPAASTAGPGFAPAALPYKNRLWRRKVLKIQIRNRHLLDRWGVKLNKFMECANRWSNGAVSKGSNHIPRFETDDEDPDIVVELNENGDNYSTIGCVEGEGPTQVYLDLRYPDKKYQEHLIVHEFGHALGLGHEHQRSDFWSWIKDHVDVKMMQRDLGERFSDWQSMDGLMDGGATPYDSGSVMHYWCKKSWLTKGYSNKKYLDEQSKFLSEGLKQALYGIHERDGNVVTEPSRTDLDFLSAEYNEVQPGKQSAKLESTKKEETGRSDSRTVPESEETDHDNGAMAHGPSPQTGPSGSASVPLDLKKEEVKDPVVPKAHLKFADNLPPSDVVAWVSQELIVRGLKLDDAVKDKLIEQEINGEAFKDLSKDDLIKEMGFKLGPCKNILKIIEDLN